MLPESYPSYSHLIHRVRFVGCLDHCTVALDACHHGNTTFILLVMIDTCPWRAGFGKWRDEAPPVLLKGICVEGVDLLQAVAGSPAHFEAVSQPGNIGRGDSRINGNIFGKVFRQLASYLCAGVTSVSGNGVTTSSKQGNTRASH